MPIAKTVTDYLQKHRIPYSVVPHGHSHSSKDSAERAHVRPERLAKAVVLIGRGGYVMVVVPGDRHVEVHALSHKLGRELALVPETGLAPLFKDCEPGAIPPIGPAYGMETIVDDSLVGQPEVYFEAGDHEDLIRVDGEQFVRLLSAARHGQFSH